MSHEPTVQPGDFTRQADAYARARPTYPPELLDQLIEHAGVAPGDSVADIGAGTGISTALLAERGFAVTAVEPNAAMRANAPPMANVTWRDGTFEQTHLPEGSQQWVVAAQAFHWADPPRALPELRRILEPGCCFSAWWNDRDNARSEVLMETVRLIHQHAPGFDELYRDRDWSAVLTSTSDFTDVTRHEVAHTVTMSRPRYLDLWRSHHRLTTAAGERFGDFIAAVERMLGSTERIDVPYLARAWSVRRRD